MLLLHDIGEDALVQRLTAGLVFDSSVLVPPGDDCAVVQPLPGHLVQLLKTDVIVEAIHFTRDMPAQLIGRKALARAISDIAAMAGVPEHALVTLVLPGDLSLEWVENMNLGLRDIATQYGVNLVGGETSRGSQIVIAITLTGSVEAACQVLRSGGRAGDCLLVTGLLGGSFASGRHLSFEPRVAQAQWLMQHAEIHAMMDLSDGLGTDLPRLANASGLGFILHEAALPCAAGCSQKQAWSDGEDYELLLAVPALQVAELLPQWAIKFPNIPLTCIGHLVPVAESIAPTMAGAGWDHFGNR